MAGLLPSTGSLLLRGYPTSNLRSFKVVPHGKASGGLRERSSPRLRRTGSGDRRGDLGACLWPPRARPWAASWLRGGPRRSVDLASLSSLSLARIAPRRSLGICFTKATGGEGRRRPSALWQRPLLPGDRGRSGDEPPTHFCLACPARQAARYEPGLLCWYGGQRVKGIGSWREERKRWGL